MIEPRRYDAIHRALLAGLLGNVGARARADAPEYLGCRGSKFMLFPGSSLFRRRPPWVMAAELSETTRLYARTVARIDPLWIERVGAHLVQRVYSEPHWQAQTAHVVAYEKVSLRGLVIVPRRRVHYGPIDPKTSREIFIRQALVEGEYRTDAPYFRHNRALLREVELLEAKLRRRDVLVDVAARFAFYDARIPAGIYNGPLFEAWRREAEAKNRRLLHMAREDVIVPGPEAPSESFPDFVAMPELGEVRLPLAYRCDPDDPADGVTVTVPLAVLSELPAGRLDWLVPGYLPEKIEALIRTLPKELRVHFIPAPDVARDVAPLLAFGEGDLVAQLAWRLARRTGVHVPGSAWEPGALPAWLRMNVRVADEAGKVIAMGRDLEAIRRELRGEVRRTLADASDSPWVRDGLTRWDFGDLPVQAEVRRPGIALRGYPAIVDAGESVSLRLLETPGAARAATRIGLRRLFALQLGASLERMARDLPGLGPMSLHYAPIGPASQLKRDLVDLILDRALFGDDDEARGTAAAESRRREEFIARAEAAWRRLPAATSEVCALVEAILSARQELALRLGGAFPPLLADALSDMRRQLAELIAPGFLASTPLPWLRQLPRFLKAIELRLRKLANAGASRDAQSLAELRPWLDRYRRRVEQSRARGETGSGLEQFRWMLEELRVSLFAQELKTSTPISTRRLETMWGELMG